jgi:hypothetical protein
VIQVGVLSVIRVGVLNVIQVGVLNVIQVGVLNVIRVGVLNVIRVGVLNVIRVRVLNVIRVGVLNICVVGTKLFLLNMLSFTSCCWSSEKIQSLKIFCVQSACRSFQGSLRCCSNYVLKGHKRGGCKIFRQH